MAEADLLLPPAALYRQLEPYADPFRFDTEASVVARLREARQADMAAALVVPPAHTHARGTIYLLPDAAWSRRVSGTFANHLAGERPERAYAVLVPDARAGYLVSIRAPRARPGARWRWHGGSRRAAAGRPPPGSIICRSVSSGPSSSGSRAPSELELHRQRLRGSLLGQTDLEYAAGVPHQRGV